MKTCPICNHNEADYLTLERIQCRRCGLIYFNKDIPSTTYDLEYNRFFNRPSDVRKAGIMAEKLANLAINNFPDPHILEVGPGNGLTTLLLQILGLDVEAVDLDCDFCKYLSAKLNITVHGGGFENFTLQGYNLIYASHIIEHYEHPLIFLAKARSILPTGGILFIDTPNTDYATDLSWKHFHTRGAYEHCSLFSLKTMEIAAAIYNFHIVVVEQFWKYGSMQCVLRKTDSI
jgi:2-polyprenyl-3-methyl-5-hydroxy-6-metoxy-1,4-benzoquinol methylase